jgi:hypothetical protein
MVKNLSTQTRGELIRALKERYMESSKKEKTKILDELCIGVPPKTCCSFAWAPFASTTSESAKTRATYL